MSVRRSDEEVAAGLLAMIAWAGNACAASRSLAEKGIEIPPATLYTWKIAHADRYDELREKHAAEMEKRLEHELRDVAALAMSGQRLAIERAVKRLEDGKDEDPGRTAANLSRVTQSSIDKMLSVSGRPTAIVETRNLGEILRSLAAKGIVQLPEEPAQVESGGE